jgi:hypothetical protein
MDIKLDVWIHIAEVVLVGIAIPLTRSLISVVLALRDATRDLTAATDSIKERLDDHEDRIRWFEGAPERRRQERRSHGEN